MNAIERVTIPRIDPETFAAETKLRGGNSEKVPDAAIAELIRHEVRLLSRYRKVFEFEILALMIDNLKSEYRELVKEVYCNSKQGMDFSVKLRSCTRQTAMTIGYCFSDTCITENEGHNAITLTIEGPPNQSKRKRVQEAIDRTNEVFIPPDWSHFDLDAYLKSRQAAAPAA